MKKTLALLLCFLMLASLASCKGGDDPTETTAATTAATTEDDGSGSGSNKSHTTILTQKERVQLAFDEVIASKRAMILSGVEHYIYELEIYDVNNAEYSYINVDMDKDGINEMIINAYIDYDRTKLLLHYEDDTVYGFLFDENAMNDVFPDGSFRWYVISYLYDINEIGYSTLSFDNGSLKFKDLCRNEDNTHFYIDGKEVTDNEYFEYENARFTKGLEFSPLDTSKWGSGRAIKLAETYWGIEHGSFDEETGYRYRLTSNLYGEKAGDNGYYDYYVCLYQFIDNSYYKHIECLRVNIETGEMTPYDDNGGCWHYGEGKG